MTKKMGIDEKDLKILKILINNARIPYSDLAKRIGLSDVAVIKRIRKLENMGLIKGYTLIIDQRKLGYNLVSITGIDVESEKLFEVINMLREIPNVKYISITSGDHSIMTVIWAKNSVEMTNIHNKISAFEGVKRVCPAIILDVIKDEKL